MWLFKRKPKVREPIYQVFARGAEIERVHIGYRGDEAHPLPPPEPGFFARLRARRELLPRRVTSFTAV